MPITLHTYVHHALSGPPPPRSKPYHTILIFLCLLTPKNNDTLILEKQLHL